MIYILEDDNSIRELVAYTLHSTGFDTQGFGRGPASSGLPWSRRPPAWCFWTSCCRRRTGCRF